MKLACSDVEKIATFSLPREPRKLKYVNSPPANSLWKMFPYFGEDVPMFLIFQFKENKGLKMNHVLPKGNY